MIGLVGYAPVALRDPTPRERAHIDRAGVFEKGRAGSKVSTKPITLDTTPVTVGLP